MRAFGSVAALVEHRTWPEPLALAGKSQEAALLGVADFKEVRAPKYRRRVV